MHVCKASLIPIPVYKLINFINWLCWYIVLLSAIVLAVSLKAINVTGQSLSGLYPCPVNAHLSLYTATKWEDQHEKYICLLELIHSGLLVATTAIRVLALGPASLRHKEH